MILYRGDSRKPSEIAAKLGFSAKEPMELESAKRHLLEYCGLNNSRKTPLELSRYIISSPKPSYISTDVEELCGGYAEKGYVYKIEIPNIKERPFTEEVLGAGIKVDASAFNPKLYLNADTLKEATIIALKHYGNVTREVTLLTSIPLSCIIGYKVSGGNSYSPLANFKEK